MQVSNSTGRGSDYRIGTNSGGINTTGSSPDSTRFSPGGGGTEELAIGTLPPGGTELREAYGSCWVEFRINGELVACGSYASDPGQVNLVERDGRYAIETPNPDAGGIAAA